MEWGGRRGTWDIMEAQHRRFLRPNHKTSQELWMLSHASLYWRVHVEILFPVTSLLHSHQLCLSLMSPLFPQAHPPAFGACYMGIHMYCHRHLKMREIFIVVQIEHIGFSRPSGFWCICSTGELNPESTGHDSIFRSRLNIKICIQCRWQKLVSMFGTSEIFSIICLVVECL